MNGSLLLQPDGSRVFTMANKGAAADAVPMVKSTYRKRSEPAK